MTLTLGNLREQDLDKVAAMLEKAKKNMREVLHIDQWQAGYPNVETFANDIKNGVARGYYLPDGTLAAVAAVIKTGEPLYDVLQTGNGEFPGRWNESVKKYAAVHRVCVDLDITCHGIGSSFIKAIAQECKSEGFDALRIDTHRYNKPMRAMLRKCGFAETGIIYIPEPNSNERITYELMIR